MTSLNDTIREVFLAHGFTIKDGKSDLKPYVYEAVHALLSKLRAPVADERDDLRGALRAFTDFAAQRRAVLGGLSPEMEAIERRAIIALASAPVAGEARMPPGYKVKVVEGHGYRITPPTGGDWVAHSDTPAGDLIAALLAAPQASEAVRDADHPVFTFLLGEGPLRGVEFGDRHPDERGAYWWRKDLRAALSAQPGAQKEQSDE